jgi:hypothetical protein
MREGGITDVWHEVACNVKDILAELEGRDIVRVFEKVTLLFQSACYI